MWGRGFSHSDRIMRDVAPGSPGACGAFALFNASSTDPALVTLRPTPPTMIESLDGDDRTPSCGTTSAGVASGCQDFGVGSPGRWRQLYHLPKKLPRAPSATVQSDAAELHAHLSMRQLQPSGSCNGPVYTVAELPTIGFCALMEFALLELARAASLGSRLVLGPNTALAWTSTWLCGRDRSLSCYFDLSGGCCAEASSFARAAAASDGGRAGGIHPGKRIQRRQVAASAGGRQAAKILRKAGLNERVTYGYSRAVTLGGPLARFNRFGGAWVHGQLALWLMRRIKPSIRDELDRRRATVLPRRRGASGWQDTSATPPTPLAGMAMAEACISMHVRRGDSCALGSRFCPANRTAAYFEAAATLRTRYGLNRLVLATDDVAAAELCAQRVRRENARSDPPTLWVAGPRSDTPPPCCLPL